MNNYHIQLTKYQKIIQSDTMFASFSVLFVFCYLIYHLKSLFLGLISMGLILLSFPMTQIICEGIFKVTYFGNLHAMVIFIVLGIAADDIFVFIDGWRQSKLIPQFQDDVYRRMAYTFRRAVRAMAVTSSTTSVAFFVNISSALMPVRAFGIFAGVIVLVNYLFVVLFFPPSVILYERHIEGKISMCTKAICGCPKVKIPVDTPAI